MEIERKYLIKDLPEDLSTYPHSKISQGYISTSPVIRIRQRDDLYYLTCKSKGLLAREEFEINISQQEYLHLSTKLDYSLIEKTRYLIPFNTYTIELDVFHGDLSPLILVEVEFTTIDEANAFVPPSWFGEDVTSNSSYQNSQLCRRGK